MSNWCQRTFYSAIDDLINLQNQTRIVSVEISAKSLYFNNKIVSKKTSLSLSFRPHLYYFINGKLAGLNRYTPPPSIHLGHHGSRFKSFMHLCRTLLEDIIQGEMEGQRKLSKRIISCWVISETRSIKR